MDGERREAEGGVLVWQKREKRHLKSGCFLKKTVVRVVTRVVTPVVILVGWVVDVFARTRFVMAQVA